MWKSIQFFTRDGKAKRWRKSNQRLIFVWLQSLLLYEKAVYAFISVHYAYFSPLKEEEAKVPTHLVILLYRTDTEKKKQSRNRFPFVKYVLHQFFFVCKLTFFFCGCFFVFREKIFVYTRVDVCRQNMGERRCGFVSKRNRSGYECVLYNRRWIFRLVRLFVLLGRVFLLLKVNLPKSRCFVIPTIYLHVDLANT